MVGAQAVAAADQRAVFRPVGRSDFFISMAVGRSPPFAIVALHVAVAAAALFLVLRLSRQPVS